jgi:PAS domain S-box-containing protein
MSEGFALHDIITDERGRPSDYRFLEVNPAFERLTGLKRADLVGRRVREVLPGIEPFWIETYGRVALTGEPAHLENYSATLDRWFEVLAYRTLPGQFAVIFTDITGRKRNEEALRSSEKQFRSMFEKHQACMLLIEPKSGAIVDANPAAALFYGYSREELRRMQITDINQLPPEEVTAERSRAAAEERTYFIFPHKLADGRVRWVEVYASPFEMPQGPVLFSIIHDITERREGAEVMQTSRLAALNLMEDAVMARLEAEKMSIQLEQATHRLQRARDELEIRVQERTAVLNKTIEALELEISQREELEETLRTSDRQVRFFASQYLTAQEQERKRIAGELHDCLASTLVAVRYRLENATARMESGIALRDSLQEVIAILGGLNKEVRRIMVDLRPTVLDDLGLIPALNWYCREFEKTYGHIRVARQTELSESDLTEALKTPIFRLTQEALNNIAKHSGASLVIFQLGKAQNRIVLTIRDNGRGFDLDETVKGLGLSTMKERTELSGGEYRLESAPGKGTVLFASWPLEA